MMSGWKTKTGSILMALGGALVAAAKVVPPGYDELSAWLVFAGTLLLALGGGTAAYGIGHKIEKSSGSNEP